MEERIDGIDIWDKHGHRVIYKVLEMLQQASHVQERRKSVVWYHTYESRQGNIDRTVLQVQDDKSDGVHYFLVAHGTSSSWEAPLVMSADVGSVVAAEIWEKYVIRR